MKFAELFTPCPETYVGRLAGADSADKATSTSNPRGNVLLVERHLKESPLVRVEGRPGLSALSAKPLVPLAAPFVSEQRYQLAGATECATRLDLYYVDSEGPWIRRHGTLLAFQPVSATE